jgi:hypothetical protein
MKIRFNAHKDLMKSKLRFIFNYFLWLLAFVGLMIMSIDHKQFIAILVLLMFEGWFYFYELEITK